ncbi:small integral membrane protein 22 [Gopherus evgoodei]|nr:small integral membrane protein 22 [Gopherus evgoodei]
MKALPTAALSRWMLPGQSKTSSLCYPPPLQAFPSPKREDAGGVSAAPWTQVDPNQHPCTAGSRRNQEVEGRECSLLQRRSAGRSTRSGPKIRPQGKLGKEPKMGSEGQNLGEEFSNQINDVLSRLATNQMFQSDWDIAAFAIFFIFIGTVLLMVLLALIHCCCCCCCDTRGSHKKVPRKKVGIDNKAMEP